MVRRVLGFGLLALLLLGAWQAAFASAPATDLARAGIDAAFARGLVVAGVPRVVLARSITAAEPRARGFGDVGATRIAPWGWPSWRGTLP